MISYVVRPIFVLFFRAFIFPFFQLLGGLICLKYSYFNDGPRIPNSDLLFHCFVVFLLRYRQNSYEYIARADQGVIYYSISVALEQLLGWNNCGFARQVPEGVLGNTSCATGKTKNGNLCVRIFFMTIFLRHLSTFAVGKKTFVGV